MSSVAIPFIKTAHGKSKPQTVKKLFATTDYSDNVGVNNSFMNRQQLDDLHRTLAALGVTRHQWIVSTYWSLYENHPYGIDLLAEAVKSAHSHGIELYALIKTFEDGGVRSGLPHTMPFPEGAVAFKDICGVSPWAHPFAARHPEMNLKRKPGTYEFTGPVKAIRLVKNSDEPTRIKAEHLSICTSRTNNRFEKYNDPVSFRESVEWRPCFPKWKQCRILHLDDLALPKDHIYMVIRCSLTDQNGDFSNENGKIIELVGPENENIPFILSEGPVSLAAHKKALFNHILWKKHARYFQMPEVQEEINDPVIDASNGRTDYVTISKINGDAYTKFLRQAGMLIKSKGKKLTLHLHAGMLMPDERGENRNSVPSLPPNFEWQWKTWINEIADDLEFRGIFKLRPWNLQRVLDTFSAAACAANKPLYFQSDFHSYPNDEGRKHAKRQEIELVKSEPGLAGFVLYETAIFTRLQKDGHIEIKPYMTDVIKKNYTR